MACPRISFRATDKVTVQGQHFSVPVMGDAAAIPDRLIPDSIADGQLSLTYDVKLPKGLHKPQILPCIHCTLRISYAHPMYINGDNLDYHQTILNSRMDILNSN